MKQVTIPFIDKLDSVVYTVNWYDWKERTEDLPVKIASAATHIFH